MKPIELYLGLDVYKDSTTSAIAEPGPKGEIRLFGTVSSDIDRLKKTLRRIGKAHPNASSGSRSLPGRRPLPHPSQPGSPFKTDKRDARAIAPLLGAGDSLERPG